MTQIPRMSISADEVNCLIHAYFQDSGFVHSAFVLKAEGQLDKSSHYGKHVPRGELVELLSKALLYSEVESHWRGNAMTKNCKAPFTLLEKHVCQLDPTVSPVTILQPLPPFDGPPSAVNGISEKRKAASPIFEDVSRPKEKRARTEEMEVDSVASAEPQPTDSRASVLESPIPAQGVGTISIIERSLEDNTKKAIGMLKGHQSEVFVCAWNPKQKNILSTGSKDTVINIWNIRDPSPDAAPSSEPPITLSYLPKTESGDLTSLDWNHDGTLVASGSVDCLLRVCDASGQLYFSHDQHKGPIFATRFSKSGKYLLTSSLDGTVCQWDVEKKSLEAQYSCHEEVCLDVEWISEDIFASCGADSTIKIMRLGHMEPIKTLTGHADEVNQIKCNPSCTKLASCSDDHTARIWDISDTTLSTPTLVEQTSAVVLSGHHATVSVIAWCPTGSTSSTSEGSKSELLVTSSFDGTARLWDAISGDCLKTFSDHREYIYALTICPDGRFFATGGADGCIFIYDITTKERRWAWHSPGGPLNIFEMDWQQTGEVNRLAFGMSSGSVGIVDISRIPALRIQSS